MNVVTDVLPDVQPYVTNPFSPITKPLSNFLIVNFNQNSVLEGCFVNFPSTFLADLSGFPFVVASKQVTLEWLEWFWFFASFYVFPSSLYVSLQKQSSSESESEHRHQPAQGDHRQSHQRRHSTTVEALETKPHLSGEFPNLFFRAAFLCSPFMTDLFLENLLTIGIFVVWNVGSASRDGQLHGTDPQIPQPEHAGLCPSPKSVRFALYFRPIPLLKFQKSKNCESRCRTFFSFNLS